MNMNEEKYEIATELIAHAGTAKSCALEAIDEAADGKFDSAEELLKEGRAEMAGAHKTQFGILAQEASGTSVEVNIILVHALDHVTMAVMTLDLAERIIGLEKRLGKASTNR